jgi:O-antigen ligase
MVNNNYKNLTQINSFFFYKIPYLLILLLPINLIIGSFPSDLTVSIIGLIFLINIIMNNTQKYSKSIFFNLFLWIWGFFLMNSIFHNFNLDSYRIAISYIRFGLFTLCFWYLIDLDTKILKHLFFIFLGCFLILIIDGIFQSYTGKNFIGYELYNAGPRVSSFFKDELILGSYLSRLFPILLALFFFSFKNRNKYHYIGLLVLTLFVEIMTVLSGERTSFFYLNLFVFYFILFNNLINFKNKIKIIGSLIIFFIILFVFSSNFKNRIIYHTLEQGNLFQPITEKINESEKRKKYIFSEQHHYHFLTSINVIKSNFLFGVGIKNYKNICTQYSQDYILTNTKKFDCKTHPHNIYLQVFLETGIIGFMSLFAIFLFLIKKSIQSLFKKKNNSNHIYISLLGSILISLWPFVPTGNFFNNYLNIIFYYPAGILLWLVQGYKKKNG